MVLSNRTIKGLRRWAAICSAVVVAFMTIGAPGAFAGDKGPTKPAPTKPGPTKPEPTKPDGGGTTQPSGGSDDDGTDGTEDEPPVDPKAPVPC